MSNTVKGEKSLTMTMLMTPDKANFSGKNVHGGEILKMLDHVAYACAARYSGGYAVTLSVDMVLFKDPIKIGSLVTFHASVNYVGRTSMEIGIKVISEDIKDHTIKNTNVCDNPRTNRLSYSLLKVITLCPTCGWAIRQHEMQSKLRI